MGEAAALGGRSGSAGLAQALSERTELALALKLRFGEAFAAASDRAELIEGAHASRLLYVFDESKAIAPAVFDAAEGGIFRRGSSSGSDTAREALALALSTPGAPSGRFYEIQRRAPGYEDWTCRAVSLAECVAAGRVSAEWAEQRARQWGPGKPDFHQPRAGRVRERGRGRGDSAVVGGSGGALTLSPRCGRGVPVALPTPPSGKGWFSSVRSRGRYGDRLLSHREAETMGEGHRHRRWLRG